MYCSFPTTDHPSKCFDYNKYVISNHPDRYVEFASHCRKSCPIGFESVGNVCEECFGLCEKGLFWTRVSFTLALSLFTANSYFIN